MSVNFTFQIVSPKYGTFEVIAPERFRKEIERYIWCVHSSPLKREGCRFYVRSAQLCLATDGLMRYLHQYVWSLMGNPRAEQLDHKNGQPLDNSEDNIRSATYSQNQQNQQRQRNNTSGAVGVSFHTQRKRWVAYIDVDGVRKHIGLFDSLEDAIDARDAAALKYFGEFAVLNRKKAA